MPPVNQKQITGKLEPAENATSESDESTISQPKSKLDDCISRQQAVDEIGRWLGYLDEDMIARIRIGISNLPPVTPTVSEDCISKRVISDSLIHRISELNAEGEKAIPIARELIRFKRFVDDMAPVEPTERTGEWIPVSERLPENGVKVLCCDKRGDIYFGCHENTGWYWEAEACADYWAKDPTVIAWQPLPEPYKVGDTE